MASSPRNSASPLADYEVEDDKPDQCRGRHRINTGLPSNPDSPDMMDVEGGESTQFSDYTFSMEENKERLDKTDDSLSTKARQFIAKNKNRAMGLTKAGSDGKTITVTNTAEDPPPSPAPTSNTSQGKDKTCDELIDFLPQFSQLELQGSGLPTPLHWGTLLALGGGGGGVARPDAWFRVDGDARCFAATNFHRTDINRNISASVTVGLQCLACDTGHSYRDSIREGIPIVMVLSDQAFPAILPATDNNCVVVVRVEDGLLSEIENAFCDLFAEFLTPGGGLPRGSLIMIGSLSHLGTRGLDSYAGDLCGTISSVSARAGPSVEVVPFVPVPVAGIGGGGESEKSLISTLGLRALDSARMFCLMVHGAPSGRLSWRRERDLPSLMGTGPFSSLQRVEIPEDGLFSPSGQSHLCHLVSGQSLKKKKRQLFMRSLTT
jgi:hypothetical protein